ncbi:MAG: rubrerythrin family protein, partial [Gemmatimonadota bacterium]
MDERPAPGETFHFAQRLARGQPGEERHAAHWERLLGDEAGPHRRGHARMRLLAFLARRFGSVFVLALAQRAETRSPYRFDTDA